MDKRKCISIRLVTFNKETFIDVPGMALDALLQLHVLHWKRHAPFLALSYFPSNRLLLLRQAERLLGARCMHMHATVCYILAPLAGNNISVCLSKKISSTGFSKLPGNFETTDQGCWSDDATDCATWNFPPLDQRLKKMGAHIFLILFLIIHNYITWF